MPAISALNQHAFHRTIYGSSLTRPNKFIKIIIAFLAKWYDSSEEYNAQLGIIPWQLIRRHGMWPFT
eukprot:2559404-Pyramimonas_sp.AAC.1